MRFSVLLPLRGLLPVLLMGLIDSRLASQSIPEVATRTWPVDSVLARFEADIRAHSVNSVGRSAVMGILVLPSSYEARKDSLLNGLEHLALSSRNSDVATRAAAWIAFAGQGGKQFPPRPGVVSRLIRIYRDRDDAGVRLGVRNEMPLQTERRAAVAFLRSLATEPDTFRGNGMEGDVAFGDPRTEALARLAEMGDDGRAVLQIMHRSGEARSPQARFILEDMARRGFPVRDIARLQQERDRAQTPGPR